MRFLTFRNTSFRWLVKQQIKLKHKNAMDSPVKKFRGFLQWTFTHQSCWIAVVILVVFLFSISPFINIDALNFLNLEPKNAEIIIDQRTSNIATVISISLVVVGFLINNLAVKSAITYKLLFRKSYFYFVIYLTLSTIGCFILISLLRDTIGSFAFSRMVIVGTYIVLFILIVIGYLFRKIIQFTNEKIISSMLKDELLEEGRKKLSDILLKQYSENIYPTLFKNFKEERITFNIGDITNSSISFSEVDESTEEIFLLVHDVNIWILEFYLWLKRISTEDIFFYRMILEKPISNKKEIICSNEKPNNILQKWFLRKSIILKKPIIDIDDNAYRKEFDEKIVQLAEDGKYQNLENSLQAYLELYNLQMNNQL